MIDYVADYVANYAAEYASKKSAPVFWECVSNLMESDRITEAEALRKLDPTGRKRAKYPCPENFPDCFAPNGNA